MYLALFLTLACGGRADSPAKGAPAPKEAPAKKPSPAKKGPASNGDERVVVILLDDVGLDRMEGWGLPGNVAPTPHMDALAAQGTRFTSAYTYPSCSPTRAALLTGRHTRRYGLGSALKWDKYAYELPEEEVLIPEMLAAAGFDSSVVGKWHLNTDEADNVNSHPNRQGFGYFAGVMSNVGFHRFDKVIQGKSKRVEDVYLTTDTTNDAIARAKAMKGNWFLYVAYNAIHVPNHKPPKGLHDYDLKGAPDKEMNLAMLQALDKEVGRLVATLDLSTTTVIVMGDNGTDKVNVHPPYDPARAKSTTFDGGVHVPMFVVGKRAPKPGTTSDAWVHILDVFPTIAEWAGVDLARVQRRGEPLQLDGISFDKNLKDPSLGDQRQVMVHDRFRRNGAPPYVFWELAIQTRKHKFVRNKDTGERFYALSGEQPDPDGPDLLASGKAPTKMVDRLKNELDAWEKRVAYEY